MEKDFDGWHKKKKYLEEIYFSGYVHEREIWWCSLGINLGHEQDGKHNEFERPVLVIKKWSQETIVVVPLTTKIKQDKFHYVFTHNGVAFAIILSQIRLVSTKRLMRRIRKISRTEFCAVRARMQSLIFN